MLRHNQKEEEFQTDPDWKLMSLSYGKRNR